MQHTGLNTQTRNNSANMATEVWLARLDALGLSPKKEELVLLYAECPDRSIEEAIQVYNIINE